MLEATSEQPQINVLIVDDSKLARVHLARLLESENMLCEMAESAEDMLHYLQEERPDVIFLDHNMPGMSGLAALKIIKANPSTAIIPVMMYTSESDEVYLGKARALGAFDVLVKEELEPVKLAKRLQELNLRPKPPVQTRVLEVKVDNTQEIDARDFFTPRERLEQNNARMLQQIHQQQWRGQPVDLEEDEDFIEEESEFDATIPAPRKPLPQFDTPQERTPIQYFLVPFSVFLGGVLLAMGLIHYFVSPLIFDDDESVNLNRPQLANDIEQNVAPATQSERLVNQVPPPTTQILPPPVAAPAVAASGIEVDVLLNALSWSMRQRMVYDYSELPLSGDRLNHMQTLLNYLNSAGFKGVVKLQVFSGRFCLSGSPEGRKTLPANGMPISSCEFVAVLDEPNVQDLQSRDFSRFLQTSPLANGEVGIEIEIEAMPEDRNPFPYPLITDIAYATQWNNIATSNNMVLVQLERR